MAERKRKLCGAKTRSGKPCKRRAGAGTDHLGHGRCSNHGGATRNGAKHAAREEADELVSEVAGLAGVGEPIDPHAVLERLVWMAWAKVQWFTSKVEALQSETVLVRPRKEAMGGKEGTVRDLRDMEQLNLWIQLQDEAMERAARMSTMAIKAGVEERTVRVAETYGQTIGMLLERVFGDLRLTPEQLERARESVPRHLAALTQPKGAA